MFSFPLLLRVKQFLVAGPKFSSDNQRTASELLPAKLKTETNSLVRLDSL